VNYTGAIDTITLQYSFTGAVLRTLVNHRKSGNTVQNHTVLTKMDYDHRMRLRHIWKNIDGAAGDQLIDSLQYNEFGQLRAKYLGNNVDSLIYEYNIRGWLTAINKKYVSGNTNQFFGLELGYDKTSSAAAGNTYTTPEFNGTIEGTVWKTAGSGINRKYDYTYDNAGRLTSAAFLQNTASTSWDNSQVDFSVGNLSYDPNGNMLTLEQKGFLVGGSQFIDQLKYTYQSNSNQLSQVYDTANNPTSLLGDFHWSGTKQSSDYSYDGNGNLVQDNNRAIDAVNYNYLNLAQTVHMNGKGNITYTYDALGTRLAKVVSDSLARHSTTLLYIAGFVYQQTDTITNLGGGTDTLQFVAHEEGRVRWAFHKYTTGTTAYKFEYDFFERDHLGNTRMVLTQQRDTTNYLASMEGAFRNTESQLFANIPSTSYAWSTVPGYSGIPSGTRLAITNPNDSVSKVNYTGTGGQKTGPSLLLKVMSGDTINMAVQAYYSSNTATTTNNSFTDVLNSLAAGLMSTATGQTEGSLSGFTSSTGPVYGGLMSFLTNNQPAPPSGYPKAYLNWIFLDDQFNYVSGSSGAVAVASSTYPAGQLNTVAPGSPLNISKNGYLYVWVSNETQGWDVFFDNLSAQHKQGPVLEENHYYPFGLSQAGISDKAIKTQYAENKYRYDGGSELQSKEFSDGSGLELYEATFRSYDPQLGRFFQLDPMADVYHTVSPYAFAMDNPVSGSDPTGAAPIPDPGAGSGIGQLNDILNAFASGDDSYFLFGGWEGGGGGDGGGGGGAGGPGGAWGPVSFGPGATTLTTIFSAEEPGFAGSPVAAYIALMGVLGQPPSTTDTYLVSLIFQQTWGNEVTNVNATLVPDGMMVSGIEAINGKALSDYHITNSEIQADIDEAMTSGREGEEGKEGEHENPWELANKVWEVTAFSTETTLEGINGAQKLAKVLSGSNMEAISLESRTLTASMGVLSIGLNVAKGLSNEDGWHASNTADIGINVVEIGLGLFEATSPIGWIFGAGMFVGNMISEHYTGKSITENLFDK
jgi:RHS repeat-associated protein